MVSRESQKEGPSSLCLKSRPTINPTLTLRVVYRYAACIRVLYYHRTRPVGWRLRSGFSQCASFSTNCCALSRGVRCCQTNVVGTSLHHSWLLEPATATTTAIVVRTNRCTHGGWNVIFLGPGTLLADAHLFSTNPDPSLLVIP